MTYQLAKEPVSRKRTATLLAVAGVIAAIAVAFIFILPMLLPPKTGIIEDYSEYKLGTTITGFQKGNTIQWIDHGLVTQSPPAKTAATFTASAFQDGIVGNFTDKSTTSNLEPFFVAMKDATHTNALTTYKSWLSINIWINEPLGNGADTQFCLYFSSYSTTKVYSIALITFPTWSTNALINYKNSGGVATTANGPTWFYNHWMNVKCILEPPYKFYMQFDGVPYKLSSTSNFTALDDPNITTHGMDTIHCNLNSGVVSGLGSVYLGYIFASWAL